MTPRPVAPTADVHAALAAPPRRRLLAHLEAAASALDAHALATEVGLHPSTVRFHLETLVSAGLVERAEVTGSGRTGTVGRPRIGYAVVRPDRSVPDYEDLARLLAHGLGGTAVERDSRAERIGSAWADELAIAQSPVPPPVTATAVVERTTRLLDDLGFRPDKVEDLPTGVRIALRCCPFREVARDHPEVCALHRGLLAASLEAMGGRVTGRLLPFVEPEVCLVHLDHAAGGTRDREQCLSEGEGDLSQTHDEHEIGGSPGTALRRVHRGHG